MKNLIQNPLLKKNAILTFLVFCAFFATFGSSPKFAQTQEDRVRQTDQMSQANQTQQEDQLNQAPTQNNQMLSVAVTPPTAFLKMRPGSVSSHSITIENISNSEVELTPRVVDFSADGKTGKPVLKESLSVPYLQVPEDGFPTITIEPDQKAQLTLRLRVPEDAPNREYPMTVLFESQTQVVGSIGSNLILLVSDSDALPFGLSIDDWGTARVSDSFRPLTFSPSAHNLRYAATVASGSAKIKNWQGNTVAEYEIYPDVILGFSSRKLRHMGEISQPIPRNQNEPPPAIEDFEYRSAFLLGPYVMEITLENEMGSFTSSQMFVALPFSVMLVVGLGLTTAGIYFWKIKRDDPWQ